MLIMRVPVAVACWGPHELQVMLVMQLEYIDVHQWRDAGRICWPEQMTSPGVVEVYAKVVVGGAVGQSSDRGSRACSRGLGWWSPDWLVR